MEESQIDVCEAIPASRKLQATDARNLLKSGSRLIVAKGKKLREFSVAKSIPKEALVAMLGPTGNLRAPTIRVGKTLLVGFNQDAFSDFFGSIT